MAYKNEFTEIIRELPYSGKCYLICDRYAAETFSADFAAQVSRLQEQGARTLYFACRDASFASNEGFSCAGYTFRFYSDFEIMEKSLLHEDGPVFRIKRMAENNAPLYAALHNEAFTDVPNAMTVDELEWRRILTGPYEAGFFMYGGEPLGTFELDYSGDVPEIAAVAIRPPYQGAGRGMQAMRTLEENLLARGDTAVKLLVATANARAHALYKARGFCRAQRVSRWFSVSREADAPFPSDQRL